MAGVQDARFQELMPDIFHWLGIKRIDRFASMSDMKHDALVSQGIEIGERLDLPNELIPQDAHVEMEAKRQLDIFGTPKTGEDLDSIRAEKLQNEVRFARIDHGLDDARGCTGKRCGELFTLAGTNDLKHFTVDMSRLVEQLLLLLRR